MQQSTVIQYTYHFQARCSFCTSTML